MTGAPRRLRLIDAAHAKAARSDTTTPIAGEFTRIVATPAALPWRQRQIAELDARLGAPSAAATVNFRLDRTEPWRPGGPGQFTVVYVHGDAAPARSRAREGETLTGWASKRLESERNRLILALAIVIASMIACGAAGLAAWGHRQDTLAALSDLDDRVALAEHRATQTQTLKRQARTLDRLGARASSPDAVLADIGWVSRKLKPQVTLSGLHWVGGVTAVEAQGGEDPFEAPDRPVQRSRRPVRPNVWLWGVMAPQGGLR